MIMDKGLQIQVELSRKGEEIVSRILRDFERISKQRKQEYLLSAKTIISISDYRIWTYGLIKDEDADEICTISSIENYFGSRRVVKEALRFYFINSEFSHIFTDEDFSESERRTKIELYPPI